MGATTDDDGVGSLHARLGEILEQAGHDEVWQVKLEPLPSRRASTLLVLTKFLAAWDGNVDKAAEALLATLRWRKDYFRLDREAQARGQDMSEHSRRALDDPRFKGLGYVVRVEHQDEDRESVITFNIYGAVDDVNATFSDLDKLRSRRLLRHVSVLTRRDEQLPEMESDAHGAWHRPARPRERLGAHLGRQ